MHAHVQGVAAYAKPVKAPKEKVPKVKPTPKKPPVDAWCAKSTPVKCGTCEYHAATIVHGHGAAPTVYVMLARRKACKADQRER